MTACLSSFKRIFIQALFASLALLPGLAIAQDVV